MFLSFEACLTLFQVSFVWCFTYGFMLREYRTHFLYLDVILNLLSLQDVLDIMLAPGMLLHAFGKFAKINTCNCLPRLRIYNIVKILVVFFLFLFVIEAKRYLFQFWSFNSDPIAERNVSYVSQSIY